MNRDLTPIVDSMMDTFRRTGRLSQGQRAVLQPDEAQLALQELKDSFTRTVRDDNGDNDLDLRPNHLVDWRGLGMATWEGDFHRGQLERQNLDLPRQNTEILGCRAHSVSFLSVDWNREEAQFEAVYLDRFDSRKSYRQSYALYEYPLSHKPNDGQGA